MTTVLAKFTKAVIPLLLAGLGVLAEPFLTAWLKTREAYLPLMTLLLLSALVYARARRFLMITLCYVVAFLALRDILHDNGMPEFSPRLDGLIDVMYPTALVLVAVLSATSALAETFQPGTVWARRCYFGAAAIYFTGSGCLSFALRGSWQSVVLAATGMMAFGGLLFAERIVASEQEDNEEFDLLNDEAVQQALDTAHRAALQAKEWRDTLASVVAPADKSDAAQTKST